MKYSAFILFFTAQAFFSFAGPPDFRIKKVVIDAGHGGKDPGCHGASAKEKDVCLAIALNLGKYISDNYKEVEVIYTRKTDIFPSLHERAKIANDNKADLFICIHANSAKSTQVYGAETYVMGLHVSEANLEVAKRENSAILMEDNYKMQYEGFNPNSDESYIAISLLQNTYLEQSLNFASKIQKQVAGLNRYDRGVKQAGFLVLYRTAMPSVLIETGFLTNREEEQFLADSSNQSKMAFAIFEAFKEYKNEMEKNSASPELVKSGQNKEKKNEDGQPLVADIKQEKNIIENNHSSVLNHQPVETVKKEENIYKKNEAELVIFKVQVASSAKKLPKNSDKFRGLDYIVEYMDGSTYKYVTGNERSVESATMLQKKLKEQGHPDAFIVAFYKEKRITLAEANKILASGKNN